MAISEDASTPAVVTNSVTSSTMALTTASFSPPANSLLVAVVQITHAAGTPSVAMSSTIGGAPSWTAGPALNNGNNYAAIFYLYQASAPGSITVTATDSTSLTQAGQLALRVVDGAASSQTGAASLTYDNTGSSSATWITSISTTTTGSWVYLSAAGNSAEGTVTPNGSTTTIVNDQPAGGATLLAGRQSSATGTPGSTALGWTVGSSTTFSWAALEILPAAAGPGNPGPPFYPAPQPAKAKRPRYVPPRGRTYSNPGGPVHNPVRTVVNQWANSYGQGTTFTTITSAFESCVVPLNLSYSVGGGSGTPSAGNWLFVLASWTQDPAITEAHIGTGDDVRSWYREYPASNIAGNTRTSISYTPNLAGVPQYVYVAPDGQVAAMTVLVVEVAGLGPWDTVAAGAPVTNYAAAATSLSLSLGAPGAASFFIAAAGGDSTTATQALAPSGWTTLHTVSQSDGSDQLASSYLTSAYLYSSSSAQTITATAGSATDLSGFSLAVYSTGISPVPANSNPDWPHVVFEAGFGSGYATPDSEVTWTDLSSRIWNFDETTGIQFQLGQLQSTDMSIELDNWDENLSPLNSSSPYYPNMVPGTPVRLRMAFGTIGGTTVNRWYVIQRNAGEWNERITEDFRRYIYLTGTDIWASLSDTPPTFYRSEVYTDGPYAWWPCDDQPGTANVLPTALLNAAPGNTNTLNVGLAPGKGTLSGYRDTGGNNTVTGSNSSGPVSGFPPGAAIYQAGTNAGWLYGDPQGSAASIETGTGNPVSATPGSASWQASGQAGTTGSNGWFLYCNDAGFPPLNGGITIEIWFNAAYYAGGTGWVIAGNTILPITQQPYNVPMTIWEIATGSNPVCKLQLSSGAPGTGGNLNLITYNGASATSHSIYTGSDLRSNSWHMVTVNLTTTTWEVWLDGGAGAKVSGTATGMTSAWTWLIGNGDLGTNGGSTAGTGLVNGGNIALAHLAVYPYQLPYYRVLDHYWTGVTAAGQLPAPQQVQVTWADEYGLVAAVGTAGPGSTAFTPDGSTGTSIAGGYTSTSGVGLAVVVAASAPGGVTSGPSAWTLGSTAYASNQGAGHQFTLAWPFVAWTGVAPTFNVYTASSVGNEAEASVVAGDSEAYSAGYGGSATPSGVSSISSGSGASPPTTASSIGDTVGQRIERLMRSGQATSPNRCIDPDPLLVQAPGSSGGGVQAGAAIQAIQQSSSGFLAVDNLNNLFYWQRSHLASQYNSPVWALGPTTSEGHIPYHLEVRWPTDPQRVWNSITITPFSPTGANLPQYTPTNSSGVLASQAQYGAQPYAVTSWLQSTTEMQSQANWVFEFFGIPQRRVEDAKVDAAPYPVAWPMVAGANIGDICTVEDWQIGGGGTNYTYRITEIKRRIVFGARGDQVEAYLNLTLDFEPTSYFS